MILSTELRLMIVQSNLNEGLKFKVQRMGTQGYAIETLQEEEDSIP